MSDEMTNVEKLLTALLTPFQTLEDALQQLLTERSVDNAVGETLTLLGKLVGQPRNGVTDDNIFRRYVRAKIAVNRSDGLPEQIIQIARLVLGREDAATAYLHVEIQGRATNVLRIEDLELPTEIGLLLSRFLRKAGAAGVRWIVEWWPSPPDEMFAFAGDTDALGFGSTLDADAGGHLAGAAD